MSILNSAQHSSAMLPNSSAAAASSTLPLSQRMAPVTSQPSSILITSMGLDSSEAQAMIAPLKEKLKEWESRYAVIYAEFNKAKAIYDKAKIEMDDFVKERAILAPKIEERKRCIAQLSKIAGVNEAGPEIQNRPVAPAAAVNPAVSEEASLSSKKEEAEVQLAKTSPAAATSSSVAKSAIVDVSADIMVDIPAAAASPEASISSKKRKAQPELDEAFPAAAASSSVAESASKKAKSNSEVVDVSVDIMVDTPAAAASPEASSSSKKGDAQAELDEASPAAAASSSVEASASKKSKPNSDELLAEIFTPGQVVYYQMKKATILGFNKEQNLFEVRLENGEKISVSQRKLVFHPDEGKTYLVKDPGDPVNRYHAAKILSVNPVDTTNKQGKSYFANSIDVKMQWVDYSNDITTNNIKHLSQLLCINAGQTNAMGLKSKRVKLIKDPNKDGLGFYLGRLQI